MAKKPTRTGKALNLYLSPKHDNVLRKAAAAARRTLTAQVEVWIEDGAKAAGLWPPPAGGWPLDDSPETPPAPLPAKSKRRG